MKGGSLDAMVVLCFQDINLKLSDISDYPFAVTFNMTTYGRKLWSRCASLVGNAGIATFFAMHMIYAGCPFYQFITLDQNHWHSNTTTLEADDYGDLDGSHRWKSKGQEQETIGWPHPKSLPYPRR
jgi:hypothetical protein